MSSKRNTPFQEAHVVEYGLKIVDRHATKKHVAGVQCRMCIVFGKEETDMRQAAGLKRKTPVPTNNVKGWTGPPFRPELYQSHMAG